MHTQTNYDRVSQLCSSFDVSNIQLLYFKLLLDPHCLSFALLTLIPIECRLGKWFRKTFGALCSITNEISNFSDNWTKHQKVIIEVGWIPSFFLLLCR